MEFPPKFTPGLMYQCNYYCVCDACIVSPSVDHVSDQSKRFIPVLTANKMLFSWQVLG